ncbi:GNAT family N-acetyltransferase [Pseudohalioglobus sediminis]|uniref:GNAT family N-acetyltransferase n=1 Tax=Pseudohalioglobus sediminis TaxID=2606449 RepID=A0A5B0X4A2_9GAMM|nr:GNAT family N-acetyltransferase [Pseudohalioglobus sediminis]KAA1193387.1 GNAT family N-acetyltransferase [Pseudohalioglobus sediminis]
MGTQIKPLVSVHQEALVSFLEQQQGAPATHTRWKYFDEAFNSGRPRGYVALQDDIIVGMLGLIPFQHSVNGELVDTAWTCDWFVDAEKASGATGIALLKAVTSSYNAVYHTGGGDVTKRLFGRLATVSQDDAIQEYRIALRAGYLLKRAAQRQPWLGHLPLNLARNIPLVSKRSEQSSSAACSASLTETVLETFAECRYASQFHPAYDTQHVEWFCRNPDIVFHSCHVANNASALLWHPRADYPRQAESEWRLALFSQGGSSDDLLSVLRDVIDFALRHKADSVKVLASSQEQVLCQALDQAGFSKTRHLPFFAFYQDTASMPHESMSGLSYLDADNATLY